jgi:hypothetical protein
MKGNKTVTLISILSGIGRLCSATLALQFQTFRQFQTFLATNSRSKGWKTSATLVVEHDAELRYLTGALLEDEQTDTIQHKRKSCACNLLIGGARSP